MVTTPSLRQIFSDKESLREYGEGRLPSFADVERRLFLNERAQDTRLPDHYYKRGMELSLGGIKSLPALLSKGLHSLGNSHLILYGNRVHVKGDSLSDWQELLTFCPPLPLICGLIWKERFRPGTRNPVALADFMWEWLEPNTRHSCLPSPRFPQMQKLLRDSGLFDLHMHLTGATETDISWQSYLQNPFSFYCEVSKVEHKEKVREQLEQEVPGFESSLLFYQWLTTAQLLRRGFVHLLFKGAYTPELSDVVRLIGTTALLHKRNIAAQMIPTSFTHPLRNVFRTELHADAAWSDVTLDGLLYLLVMDQLDRTNDPQLAACFHYYLLILGFVNRFLVQQVHQNGFDQFQKITLNDFRNTPEKEYSRRFFQLHGNDGANLTLLEGRFAPKSSVKETIRLLTQIIGGWEKFKKATRRERTRIPTLHLVCHFIKAKDNQKLDDLPSWAIRHRTLRIENQRKAQALVTAWESYPKLKEYVNGIDAASNELETPPEVFAPTYRYCRRKGIKHFTYHAGEDFHHIIGGLRAMYEVVEFLDLRQGDRIGHGTAAGIDPVLWFAHVGDELVMSRGEWLDDLVFAIYFIENNPAQELIGKLPKLRAEADKLAHEIYRRNFTIYNHTRAWKARRCCPFHLLYDIDEAMAMSIWSMEEWRECEPFRHDREAKELLGLYHRADCRKRYHEKTKVQVTRIFNVDELRIMQDMLLAELHRKEIVLEVLPTSNVRISFYKDHSQHHLWRWLGLERDKYEFNKFPPVVVGTDDAGIFSTNIFNEYNHIFHQLTTSRQQPHDKAVDIIKQIMDNSKVYGFGVE